MKIVFLERDSVGSDISVEEFRIFGQVECYRNTTTEEQAAERIKDAEIVIVNKAPMTQKVLDQALKLQFISVTATGYNNIDVAYCNERGICVSNVSGYSTVSVAQHTFALALSLIEQTRYYDDYVKSFAYSRQSFFTNFDRGFMELHGKTWGIVGMGNIGRAVAKIAEAFGCKVIYYSTSQVARKEDYPSVSFEKLLEESDVISVHCPLTEKTKYLFNKDAFHNMPGDSYLINVARGPVVKEDDLLEALEEEYLAGAALDVFEKEPIEENNPLFRLKDSSKIIFSPHNAWATVESRSRLVHETYLNVEAFLDGRQRNIVCNYSEHANL